LSPPNKVESGISQEEEVSDIDNDLGFDQFAIKHLVGEQRISLGQKKLNGVTLNLSRGNQNQVHPKKVEVERRYISNYSTHDERVILDQ
jgi:hypothetical protein